MSRCVVLVALVLSASAGCPRADSSRSVPDSASVDVSPVDLASQPAVIAGGSSDSSGAPDRTLAGVRYGMAADEIRRLLGEPASAGTMRFDEMLGDSAQVWHYPVVTIELVGGKAETIDCASPACASGRGVRVGDREDEVFARYGATERSRDDGGESLAYPDEADGCGITFSLALGRVRSMRVWCDNS